MKALSALISFLFILGIKSCVALFECHPHKAVCDKNCGLRYGSMIILTKLCRAACSVSQCLVKNKSSSAQGINVNGNINKPADNPSLRQGSTSPNNETPKNVQVPTPSTTPLMRPVATPVLTTTTTKV